MTEQLLQKILDKLESMDIDLQTLKSNVANKNDISNIERKLNSIQEQVVRNSEAINENSNEIKSLNQATFEIKNVSQTLETIQDRQSHVIELLSVRSIEHEALLKRIK